MLICDIVTVQLAKNFQVIPFTTCCFYTDSMVLFFPFVFMYLFSAVLYGLFT